MDIQPHTSSACLFLVHKTHASQTARRDISTQAEEARKSYPVGGEERRDGELGLVVRVVADIIQVWSSACRGPKLSTRG